MSALVPLALAVPIALTAVPTMAENERIADCVREAQKSPQPPGDHEVTAITGILEGGNVEFVRLSWSISNQGEFTGSKAFACVFSNGQITNGYPDLVRVLEQPVKEVPK